MTGTVHISIAFQPIVSVTQNAIATYGYEALARTREGGCPPLLSRPRPSQKIYKLDFECQRLALSTASSIGLQTNLSINIRPGSICHPRYGIQKLVDHAQEIGFPLDRLVLEITEQEMIPDYGPLRRCIDKFRQDGLRIALDDFGTGFNGLNTLLELKPDIVKIDMALIHKIETDRDRQALLFGICSGGNRLGMRLIAEGVETYESAEILSRENVDLMQGYLFAKPQIGNLPVVDLSTAERIAKMLSEVIHPARAGDMTGAIVASQSRLGRTYAERSEACKSPSQNGAQASEHGDLQRSHGKRSYDEESDDGERERRDYGVQGQLRRNRRIDC